MTELEQKLTHQLLIAQLEAQSNQIQQLTEQLEYLIKKLYGSSSEKSTRDKNQLSLFEDPILECKKQMKWKEKFYLLVRNQKGRKAELTKVLSIEETHCELQGVESLCDHCGQEMKSMGQKVIREEVCFIPARYIKRAIFLILILVIVMIPFMKLNRFVVQRS